MSRPRIVRVTPILTVAVIAVAQTFFAPALGPGLGSVSAQGAVWLDISGSAGEKLRAAIFRPPGGPHPLVVILHGSAGLRQEVVEWAERLAQAGFVTVAPCYHRAGPGAGGAQISGTDPCPEAPARQDTRAVANINAAISAARRQPGVLSDRIGIVGWSLGASAALNVAPTLEGLRAVVAVSGAFRFAVSGRDDVAPITILDRLRVPILILHGTADNVVPLSVAKEYEERARSQAKTVEAVYLDGADHFFLIDPGLRPRLYETLTKFLALHLQR